MDITSIITLFLIGFIGSFISGMLGVGGAIIKYPMLLYIPPMMGMVTFTAHEVSGISAIEVLFASFAGVWAYRKSGYLNKKLIRSMGITILTGSLFGSYVSGGLSESNVNIVYGILAIIAAIMMFMPKKEVELQVGQPLSFNAPLAAILALAVGIASGIIGAAGGFLLIPIMLVILKIPTRITIATSLAITFISSIGGTIGKIATNQVLYGPAVVMIIASVMAAPLGANIGEKMNVKILQLILSILILATAIKIWFDIL
ncbi:sulfite exporter TauE/SafE family protein [Paenibacillus endoradicis]|uniref:sulfite exporter TauE/SafE family protein n=1 Tax=Paenibacillus endoradicis TaxID=2972487 RepID=UPI002158CCD3|nr:sulfite exporter TauE/SafE family protein [Paenibacillus endoradicis]MCR8657159.1 sulfite exporter TauE/SafE family protein [Paenibacillus endoradicis]